MQDNTHTFECHCCEQEYRWDEQVTMSPSDIVDGLAWCDTCNTDTCAPSGEFCRLNPAAVAEWEERVWAEFQAEQERDEVQDLRHEQLIADAHSVMTERNDS